MPNLLLDYAFSSTSVANPDGSFPVAVSGATVVPGPGVTPIGELPQAIDLGTDGRATVDLTGIGINLRRFCVRIVFQARATMAARQNLVECDLLPFAMFLGPGAGEGEIALTTTVATEAHGWSGPSTIFAKPLRAGVWYSADLVYDNDTAGVFVDGNLASVHAFPQGRIAPFPGSNLYIGSWVDGLRDHFDGLMAGLQLYDNIPPQLESLLDESRSQAEWFTTYKYELVKNRIDLGAPTAAPAYDAATGAYLHPREHGLIMYHDSMGVAFEMHGAIHEFYLSYNDKAELGYLVSDEGIATNPGGSKNVFSRGALYWSPATGTVPVLGQIFLEYEQFGESSHAIGFPVGPATPIAGGLEQEFQGGRMYLRDGATDAHEVHGAILAKFLGTGGTVQWGFPITHESDVLKDGTSVGRFSEFESTTIYWTPTVGAFEVHGDIRRKYQEVGGPGGELGFPISDEGDIPSVAGPGKYNCFQNGSLLWYGSYDTMVVARPFAVRLGRINTRESEGWTMGQNDVYIRLGLQVDSALAYSARQPSTGAWGGHNNVNVDFEIPVVVVPNTPAKTVVFTVDVWESDNGAPFGGGDDHLGLLSRELNMANGWGMRDHHGVFQSGRFSMIHNISWSVIPKVDVRHLSEIQKFWNVENIGTSSLSYQQYASAFRDVDSEPEWWDATDWLEKAFYELCIEGVAKKGNCFGMSLEAIYARKNMSLFGLPIDRFTEWDTVVGEFNVKQCYQLGSRPIWWFVSEFLTGNTHSPQDVFLRTRREFSRGNHPVLCLAQNYDFSGAPHCVLPVRWDDSGKPWRMEICDPSEPGRLRDLTIDPDNNAFEYVGDDTYRGTAWSGGRLHFMPFSLLSSRPRTPLWDAVLWILEGTVILVGDDATTTALTDRNGNDLEGFGPRALETLQAGQRLDNYFVQYKGYDGLARPTAYDSSIAAPTGTTARARARGMLPGELLLRRRPQSEFVRSRAAPAASAAAHLPLGSLLGDRRARRMMQELRIQPTVLESVRNRAAHFVVNDPAAMARLTPALQDILRQLSRGTGTDDYSHQTSGARDGAFKYVLKYAASEFRMEADLLERETHTVHVADLGSSKNVIRITAERSKLATLQFSTRMGAGADEVTVTMEGVPLDPNGELALNVKPGLGGLELLTGVPETPEATVSVDATVDGRRVLRRFAMPLTGGVRVKLSQVLGDSEMSVSRIERLFGPVVASQTLRSTM
jgi:hypothetical protein